MKILYLMHTDWGWIKQRSQFLAERLAERDDCTVTTVFKKSPRRKSLVKNQRPQRCWGLPFVPFGARRLPLVKKLDTLIFRTFFAIWNRISSFDAVIVTHPLLFDYVGWHRCTIYDLHDDNEMFYPPHSFLRAEVHKENAVALANASGVVFSSAFLQRKYQGGCRRTTVVRNGHNLSLAARKTAPAAKGASAPRKVYYFGTISGWFDFDLLRRAVEANREVEFHLIGPADVSLPALERVHYHGPLPHDKMIERCGDADAFIMPFAIDDLIEGVDPVKVYEYIWLGKPVIIPWYQEVEHFSPHVHFYRGADEFVSLITQVGRGTLQGRGESAHDFLSHSRWLERAQALFAFAGGVARHESRL